jgi:hypothetical protein
MKLLLTDILIGDRQRLEIGDLSDLDSMGDPEVGQIQAITVERLSLTETGPPHYKLVAGRRRIAKATELGWTEIEAYILGALTPTQAQKMELFEDVGRTDRSWQDRCLSVAKLHYIMVMDKHADAEEWTARHTSLALGYKSGTTVVLLLTVAKLLQHEPKDEEVWACSNFNEAFKVGVVNRREKEARAEMERRRSMVVVEGLPAPTPLEGNGDQDWLAGEEGEGELTEYDRLKVHPEGSNQILMPTAPQEKTVIWIHGFNSAFEDETIGDKIGNGFYLALAHNPEFSPMFLANLYAVIRPTGFACLWFNHAQHNLNSFISSTSIMPWRLIWNQVRFVDSRWPFSENYGIGVVIAGKEAVSGKLWANPSSSVITAMPEDSGLLPPNVVDGTVKALCPPNMPVICPCNAPVVSLAEAGHTPVWFEPDKAKYEEKVRQLWEYYEHNIPNVDIRLKS